VVPVPVAAGPWLEDAFFSFFDDEATLFFLLDTLVADSSDIYTFL
jgi:hypothetical protein